MKFFYRQLFVAFLLCGCAINAKAVNDTLTVGEVFNWQVGDSFIYRAHRVFIPPPQLVYAPLTGFSVVSRADYNDTIDYEVNYINPNQTKHFIFSKRDTLMYRYGKPIFTNTTVLGASVTTCDTQANCILSFYTDSVINGASSIYHQTAYHDSIGNNSVWYWTHYSERIGITHYEYYSMNQTPNVDFVDSHGFDLVYYKSGNTTWMDSALYYVIGISEQTPAPTFHLSPNPATDALTITADNQAPVMVSIYSATGVLMGNYQKPAAGALSIPVNNLPPAYYMLKLSDSDGLSATKGFIVTR